jgi:hypothetical protein
MNRELAPLDLRPLTSAMATIGYLPMEPCVYRAEWSTPQVEHFIYILFYGEPKAYLTADFGLRNGDAQAFALRSIRKFGGELYQLMRHDEPSHNPMRFSLGRFLSWGPRGSLKISTISAEDLGKRIASDVRTHLFAFIRDVTTLERLLTTLLLDSPPCPWINSNGAIRAGVIVHLARRLGMNSRDVFDLLAPHKGAIASALVKAPDPDPESYIRNILSESTRSPSGDKIYW